MNENSETLILPPSIQPVNAGEVNITEIPQYFADKMGIPVFAGQMLCSAILLFIFVLPIGILTRKKGSSWLVEMIVGFVVLGVCVALQWLPYWVMLVICLIVAGMYANKMKNVLGK